MRWAVFDVDGTVLPGTSMERLFLRDLVLRGVLSPAALAAFALTAVRDYRRGGLAGLLGNKRYFRGFGESVLERRGRAFVERRVLPRVSPAARAEMHQSRRDGLSVLLLSGSPEFLLRPLAERLGAEAAMGTVLESNGGRFTGCAAGAHLYGRAKTRALLGRAADLLIDFRASRVYANDSSDADHMRLFGTPVAVNPRAGLRAVAEREGWRVERW